MNKQKIAWCLLTFFLSLTIPSSLFANNLTLSNVQVGYRNPAAKSVAILFSVAWENSWRNKINHDAVWVTARLSTASSSEKKFCRLTASGLNPSGTSCGTNSGLEIYVPQDKAGAFIRPAQNHSPEAVSSNSVMLTIDYDSCGFIANDKILVSLSGLEMVYVPRGSFYAGDNAVSAASLRRGSVDTSPWPIQSENAISVTNTAGGAYYYFSAGNSGEFASGAAFSVPAAFPKGYAPFYAMKYEITEGDWVTFVNTLPSSARTKRDITDSAHKNSDSVLTRNTIACSGSPLVCATQRPSRPVSYLGWADVAAFMDWAGLRPMTELEFEKLARGPFFPLKGEFAWGSTDIVPVDTLSGISEEGNEEVRTSSANAVYGNTTFSGGDAALGADHQKGPVRIGIFATSSSDRVSAGAGYYGAMELSGNVKEWVVSLGSPEGLAFTGGHGDGYLTTLAGYQGSANVPGWPGMDTDTAKGIVGVSGVGFRGGSWNDAASRLRVSDRQDAALSAADAAATYGGRGVRTYDGE